jgi:uncharacterized protein YkwD
MKKAKVQGLSRVGPKIASLVMAILIFLLGIYIFTPYAYGCEDATPETLMRLINDERVANGLTELAHDAQLDAIAQARADEMASTGQFSHTRPNGEKFSSLYKVNGVWITQYGQENLARGYNSSSSAFSGWKQSESHYANILNSRVTRIGAAVASDSDGKLYYVTEFAQ